MSTPSSMPAPLPRSRWAGRPAQCFRMSYVAAQPLGSCGCPFKETEQAGRLYLWVTQCMHCTSINILPQHLLLSRPCRMSTLTTSGSRATSSAPTSCAPASRCACSWLVSEYVFMCFIHAWSVHMLYAVLSYLTTCCWCSLDAQPCANNSMRRQLAGSSGRSRFSNQMLHGRHGPQPYLKLRRPAAPSQPAAGPAEGRGRHRAPARARQPALV